VKVRSRLLALAVVAATGAVLFTLASIPRTGAHASSKVDRAVGHARMAGEVDQLAVGLATNAGDSSPSAVTWVATTRDQGNQVVSGDSTDGPNNPNVYVLEINGDFTLHVPVPPSAAEPSGTDLWVVVNATTMQTTDFGVNNSAAPLTSLGTPETDSLVGVTALTPSAFRAKYHLASRSTTCALTGGASVCRIKRH
jgi:hypothetical protein